MGGLSGSRASLPHGTGGVYLRNSAVPALRGHVRADGPAYHRGRELDHRHLGNLRQPWKPARLRLHAAAQQPNAVPPRRLSVPEVPKVAMIEFTSTMVRR